MPKQKAINAEIEVKKFFNAIENNTQSSLYTLCNLLLIANDSPQANLAIDNIEKKISAGQLKKIIGCMIEQEKNKKQLLDKERLESFKALRIELMSQKAWLTRLTKDNIITLSANDEFLLYGLIALTRHHLLEKAHKDPFDSLDFVILENAGIVQIKDVLQKLVSSCQSLPLEAFKLFAKRDIEFARGVLLFMQGHSLRFEMGDYCLEQHPALKDELYLNWKNTVESVPLTQKAETLLKSSVSTAGNKHPEFLDILQTSRLKKDAPDAACQRQEYDYGFNIVSGITCFATAFKFAPQFASLGSAIATYASSSMTGAAICSTAVSAAAAPLIGPASLLLLTGFVAFKAKPKVVEGSAINQAVKAADKYKI